MRQSGDECAELAQYIEQMLGLGDESAAHFEALAQPCAANRARAAAVAAALKAASAVIAPRRNFALRLERGDADDDEIAHAPLQSAAGDVAKIVTAALVRSAEGKPTQHHREPDEESGEAVL